MNMPQQSKITKITLDNGSIHWRNTDIEQERNVAINDLLNSNYFAPVLKNGVENSGPYQLTLGIVENRLAIKITDISCDKTRTILLSLKPFRRLIRDYSSICESYFKAMQDATPSQIEAIDMGRRGLHNEAAEFLKERLATKIDMDFDTARRLFTLICVLHFR